MVLYVVVPDVDAVVTFLAASPVTWSTSLGASVRLSAPTGRVRSMSRRVAVVSPVVPSILLPIYRVRVVDKSVATVVLPPFTIPTVPVILTL